MQLVIAMLVFAGISTVCFGIIELGHRLGLKHRPKTAAARDETSRLALGTIVNAKLLLLAFLLAITFGFAVERLDKRRSLVIDEANAIGTADLRARLLEEPHRSRIRAILLEHAEARSVLILEGKMSASELGKHSDELMARLWTQTQDAVLRSKLAAPILALLVAAINDVIDDHTTRATIVLHQRIPPAVLFILALIALLCLHTVGYQAGVGDGRRSRGTPALVLGFSLLMTLIVDMDRTSMGVIRIDQQPMLDAVESLRATPPTGEP